MTAPAKRHRRRYTLSQRRGAVDTVLSRLGDFPSVYKACEAIGPEVGIGKESLRRWVLAEVEGAENLSRIQPVPLGGNPVDVDRTPMPKRFEASSTSLKEVDQKKLVLELQDRIRHLEKANEGLKTAAAEFAREYSPV